MKFLVKRTLQLCRLRDTSAPHCEPITPHGKAHPAPLHQCPLCCSGSPVEPCNDSISLALTQVGARSLQLLLYCWMYCEGSGPERLRSCPSGLCPLLWVYSMKKLCWLQQDYCLSQVLYRVSRIVKTGFLIFLHFVSSPGTCKMITHLNVVGMRLTQIQ